MQRLQTAPDGSAIPIPGTLNVVIAVAATVLGVVCLRQASMADAWWQVLLWAIAFSYLGNTLFSLLHEAVHRNFHPDRRVNNAFGQLVAMMFPTGFHFQRAFHLGHHRRNRTDVELFDMYGPEDSKLLKFAQLYTVLTGLYWANAPIGGVLYLISPRILSAPIFRSKDPRMQALSMDAMLSGLDKIAPGRLRLELLATVLFQASLFAFLGVTWWAWLACYMAFAINWGSLQYADHAWSVRDVRNGAWNLRVNKIVQFVFLNYHHHLAHHQHPYVPWIHLHKFVDFSQPRPSHFEIWLKMWKGPTPVNAPSPVQVSREFEQILYE